MHLTSNFLRTDFRLWLIL